MGKIFFSIGPKIFFATTALFLEELCKGHVAALFFDLKSRFFMSKIVDIIVICPMRRHLRDVIWRVVMEGDVIWRDVI